MAPRLPRPKLAAPSLSSEEDARSARNSSDSWAEYWEFKLKVYTKFQKLFLDFFLNSSAQQPLRGCCTQTPLQVIFECSYFPFLKFSYILFSFFLFSPFLFHTPGAETFHVLWNWPTHSISQLPLFPLKNHSTMDIKGMFKKLVLSWFCSHTAM